MNTPRVLSSLVWSHSAIDAAEWPCALRLNDAAARLLAPPSHVVCIARLSRSLAMLRIARLVY
eukprot:6179182-Pleurochrysis_carterae.AAC.1